MKERSAVEWRIPACRTGRTSSSPPKTLQLPNPFRLQKQTSTDVDYELVTFADRAGRFQLRFWKYTQSSGLPSTLWLKGLTNLSIRPFNLAGVYGYDIRGETDTGQRARWVFCIYTGVQYRAVDPATAKIFDSMIDQMCYQ